MLQSLTPKDGRRNTHESPHGRPTDLAGSFAPTATWKEIQNPGLSPVVVSVTISGNLGLDNNTRIVVGAFGLAT